VKRIEDFTLDAGERRGLAWLLTRGRSSRKVRHLLIDVNFWKSFIHRRLTTALGDRGSISLFKSADDHRMLCDHLTSERCEIVMAGRTIEEWELIAAGRDNHWLDCLVGAAVAASIQGCALITNSKPPKQRVPLAQMGRK
jgi:hypothetical protein